MTPDSVETRAAYAFVVAMGRALHRYGAPVHRLERALEEISASLGLRASFLATPTSLQTIVDLEDGDQMLYLERQNSGSVDLGKLAELDELAQRAIGGEIGVEEARAEVDRVLGRPSRYRAWQQVLAFALSSAGFSVFLGAGWLEAGAGALAGLLSGILSVLLAEGRRGSELFEPLAAFVLAFAVSWVGHHLEISVPLVLLAGLIVLVPGLTVTQAVTELAQSSLVAGTSRLFGAALVFLLLAFGSMLGTAAASAAFGPRAPVAAAGPLPVWVLPLAVLVTSVSFLVMFRARPTDLPAIFVCGLVSFAGAWGTLQLAPEGPSVAPLAAFVGALVAGLTSNAYARIWHRPALVPRVPAMMHLVPGSLGFRAVSLFSARDPLGGVELVFTVALIAVAIATGLFSANALVMPRQRL